MRAFVHEKKNSKMGRRIWKFQEFSVLTVGSAASGTSHNHKDIPRSAESSGFTELTGRAITAPTREPIVQGGATFSRRTTKPPRSQSP
ncbi:hypothetical protein AVEN_117861-1 [Araneus ventricosus]|uniref:Uncharacterized protein n=1 Tax=Araneus ventricosus TaxID=182803 RepID=A0A4Y2VNU4_ARAVE|nr:hypothetical protein AVEN_117861-1 [Araneus ventricosus]